MTFCGRRGYNPRLTIVTTNSDHASAVYIRNKVRRCEEIGVEVDVQRFDVLGLDEVGRIHYKYNPIIFQLPLNMGDFVSLEALGDLFDERCDVDGFLNAENIAALASDREPANYPCAPKGIVRLLDEYQIPIEGASVCVIGRSNIVGRPLARMLEQRNATVTLCHSKTALRQKITTFVPPLTPWPSIWCDPSQVMCTQMQNTARYFPQEQGGPDATIARLKAELANVNCNIMLSEQQKRFAAMISQCCTNNLNRGLW